MSPKSEYSNPEVKRIARENSTAEPNPSTLPQTISLPTPDFYERETQSTTTCEQDLNGLESIGRYKLLERLGAGGMGEVFRAWDTQIKRAVALKTMLAGTAASAEEIDRFYQEAQAAARAAQEYIIPVYDIGEEDGRHYFTMEYIEGGTLAKQREQFWTDSRRATKFVEKAARAIHKAHEKGIIHRDLKPTNILVRENGDPCISDFGIAKMLDSDLEKTRTGQRVGTVKYMSPEAAAGLPARNEPKTDVWALGVILYELLTKHMPFVGDSYDQISDRIRHAAPPPPRQWNKRLDPRLETIILKCLEKETTDRYESAEAFADDLRHVLNDEPIRARPRPRWSHAGRHVRRNAVKYVGGAAIAIMVVITAFALARFGPAPAPDQGRNALQKIYVSLRGGNRIELASKNKSPVHHRWLADEGKIKHVVGKDDPAAFSVHSDDTGLFELLPDPQSQRYRLSVDMRQESVERLGKSGLFIMHHKEGKAGVEQLYFLSFTYSETGALAGRGQVNLFVMNRNPPPRPGIPAINELYKIRGLDFRFDPAPQMWRKLELAVTPRHVTVYFDGEEKGQVDPAELNKRALKYVLAPNGKEVPVPDPNFNLLHPRGGLGLFVQTGDASVQRVVLTPTVPKK